MEVFSGAVHDAAKVGRVCDTVMVFAVSEDGKSHTEAEYTSWADSYSAANTLANAALDLAEWAPSRRQSPTLFGRKMW